MTARITIAAVLLAALGAGWAILHGSSATEPTRRSNEPVSGAGRSAVTFESGDFTGFDGVNESNGSLSIDNRVQAYDGTHAARARYDGGGANGYARAVKHVSWRDGDEVWYSAAFWLPSGFKRAMQGEVALMRWDDWPSEGQAGTIGGLVVWHSDRRARVVFGRYGLHAKVLAGPFDVPERRWFHVLVHQRLGRTPGQAVNELYVDGLRTDRSREPNIASQAIQRIRYGLVAVAPGAQRLPLELLFDRSTETRSDKSNPAAPEIVWALGTRAR